MKKIFVITLALFLAVPALSYAGSATSKFDMTIGGAVNFNFGYQTKTIAADSWTSGFGRDSSGTSININSESGSVRYSPADSTINFLSRGPEAFGAKTMGFLEIDFRGGNTGNAFGAAQVKYAFVKFDWANSYLLFGQAGPETLSLYARKFIIAGDHGATEGFGGIRPIQIAYRYNFTKNFNAMFGFIQHTNQYAVVTGATTGIGNLNAYGRSEFPAMQADIEFKSDSCGVIGPDMLKISVGGVYGQEKKQYIVSGNTTNVNSDTIPQWMAGVRAFVPIIPEKKGNKTNAFSFSGIGYVGQNALNFVGPPSSGVGSYWRSPYSSVGGAIDAASPTMFGGLLQLTYYASDKTFFNVAYGQLKQNYSSAARSAAALGAATVAAGGLAQNETDWKGVDRINSYRVYSASIFHDPSASTRLAFQWSRMFVNFNGYGGMAGTATVTAGTGNQENASTVDQYKAMVMYFF